MKLPKIDMGARQVALGTALIAVVIAAVLFWVAWQDHRQAAQLRDHGVLTMGRFQEMTESESGGSSSSGTSPDTYYGIWSYSVGGRSYQLQDRGTQYQEVTDTVPRLGPVAPNQIIYLPEDADVARLRTEIGPDVFALIGGGGSFLIIAAVFGGVGVFLLKGDWPD